MPGEFILELDIFQELISNFQQPPRYMPAQTKANADTKHKKRKSPDIREFHSRGSHTLLVITQSHMPYYKNFPPKTTLSTVFLSALFFLLAPVLHAPPCLSTKPIKGSWVLVWSLEQAQGGGQTQTPLRWPHTRAWGGFFFGGGGLKAER